MNVLGIETSCDETGLAIYSSGREGVVAEALHSQARLHSDYGGVVPELASRDHIRRLVPLLRRCLKEADLELQELDAIAYTAGPGLVGALLTGACFAQSLAASLNRPALGVHHLEAHLLVALMAEPALEFPFVSLLVSGGHTQLLLAAGTGRYSVLGETLDDAAGEAFDKVAQLLGLGYPGGPAIATAAVGGDPQRFRFPLPLSGSARPDFSFSGLKTSVRRTVMQYSDEMQQSDALPPQLVADIAASFQETMVAVLTEKCLAAVSGAAVPALVIAGGVAANRRLREVLGEALAARQVKLYCPPPAHCTDNGAMVAYAGWQYLCQGRRGADGVQPRWPLTDIAAVGP